MRHVKLKASADRSMGSLLKMARLERLVQRDSQKQVKVAKSKNGMFSEAEE
jgi:hypothetical protein